MTENQLNVVLQEAKLFFHQIKDTLHVFQYLYPQMIHFILNLMLNVLMELDQWLFQTKTVNLDMLSN